MQSLVTSLARQMVTNVFVFMALASCVDPEKVCVILFPDLYDEPSFDCTVSRSVKFFVRDMLKKDFKVFVIGREVPGLNDWRVEYISRRLSLGSDFQEAWEKLKVRLTQGGRSLVVYYAGHGTVQGIRLSIGGQGGKPVLRGVPWSWLAEGIASLSFTYKIVFLDCCHAGAAKYPLVAKGISLMAACRADEKITSSIFCRKKGVHEYKGCFRFTRWLHRVVLFADWRWKYCHTKDLDGSFVEFYGEQYLDPRPQHPLLKVVLDHREGLIELMGPSKPKAQAGRNLVYRQSHGLYDLLRVLRKLLDHGNDLSSVSGSLGEELARLRGDINGPDGDDFVCIPRKPSPAPNQRARRVIRRRSRRV